MRGLYVHIPFCARKCHYCDFVITVNRSDDFKKRFLNAFESEVKQARERYGQLTFDTLYFGGGTPSALTNEELRFIFNLLQKTFSFAPAFEFTVEMNPEDVNVSKLDFLRSLGTNRISMGIQSFDNDLLREMGRLHSSKEGEQAIRLAQTCGFGNITIDLINRLPDQNSKQWQTTLEKTVSLSPAQISIYDLEVHEHTVFGVKAKEGKMQFPDEEKHLKMAEFTYHFLDKAGFVQYELLSFAKPGFESKHNMIYWHNQDYLGVGPGAFSYLNGIRYQFARDVARYLDKCEQKNWTNDAQDILTDEEKEMEALLTGLRLDCGVLFGQFPLIAARLEKETAPYIEEGLLERRGDRLFFTLKGRFVAEDVLSELTAIRKKP